MKLLCNLVSNNALPCIHITQSNAQCSPYLRIEYVAHVIATIVHHLTQRFWQHIVLYSTVYSTVCLSCYHSNYYDTILYCTVHYYYDCIQCCTVLYYSTVLYCVAIQATSHCCCHSNQYNTVLQCSNVIYSTGLYCTVYCTLLCCTVLQYCILYIVL